METVAQLLDARPSADGSLAVWAIQPYQSVYDAIEAMALGDLGALVVTDGDKPVGIVSERDYARKGILCRRYALDTIVADIMSTPLICVAMDDRLATCMQRMVDHDIRHLPVVTDERLVGMITIADILKAVLDTPSTSQRGWLRASAR